MRGDRRLCLVPAAAVLTAVAGRAPAQPVAADDGGPVIVGERREGLEPLRVERFELFVDIFGRYLRDHRDRSGLPDLEDTEFQLRESLGISTRAFVGHENLLDVTADVSLGWEDRWFDRDSEGIEDGHESGLVAFFDVEGVFLKESQAPFRVWALRDETIQNREFAGTVEATLEEYGASVRLLRDVAPTTLTYFHRVRDQEDGIGLVDDRVTQDTFAVQSVWSPTEAHRVTLDYAFDMVDEERLRGLDDSFHRHDLTAVHEWRFGSDRQHRLRSTLRFLDETGERDQTIARLNEILTLIHSRDLESRYFLTLEHRDVGGQLQRSVRGNAQVTHRLFESLVTTATAGGSFFDLPDDNFTNSQVFGQVNWEYTKQVPLGRVDASLTLGIDHTDQSERGDEIMVIGQPAVFEDPFPVVIPQRNVEAMSIVVRDPLTNRTFVEGRDYVVRALPTRVELERVVGGEIAQGEAVVLDYDIGPQPGVSVTSFQVGATGRYTFTESFLRGLSVYAEFREISQSVDTADPLFGPRESTVIRAGAEYRRSPFTLRAEYESQDSTTAPFEALRLEARYDQRLGIGTVLTASASHDRFEFTDTGSETFLTQLRGEARHRVGGGLDVRLELIWRDEENSDTADTRGFEQNLELNWRRRQTSVFVSARNSMLESDDEDIESQAISFGIRREF